MPAPEMVPEKVVVSVVPSVKVALPRLMAPAPDRSPMVWLKLPRLRAPLAPTVIAPLPIAPAALAVSVPAMMS